LTKAKRTIAVKSVGTTSQRLWGQTLTERLHRQVARISPEEIAVDRVLLARADAVIDQPLVAALASSSDTILVSGATGKPLAASVDQSRSAEVETYLEQQDGNPPQGFAMKTPEGMGASFWKALRKKETPYALQVSAANKDDIEWRMFMGTYKGATDLVTKHVWPVPAFYATRWLASFGVTPNAVTSIAALATVLAFYWFWTGSYGLGLLAAWLMTFLDTVDGKLARTTLTSSKWGDIFDHGIDLIHPPFWYVAWAVGLSAVAMPLRDGWFGPLLLVIIGGYVVQRLMEGVAIKWLGLEIHIWRKIDTLFRQVTARRNPNLVLLTVFTLFGRPDLGLWAVAIWTAICLVLHGIQLWQALAAKRTAPDGLTSWMSKP
jgi:phosphatidylglycerophosphate synthase